MKIVYLSKSLIPSRSANSIQVMKMCQAFAKCGNEVTLVAPDSKHCESGVENVYAYYSVEPIFHIKKLSKPSFYGGRLIYDMKILQELVRHQYDLVYGRYLEGCFISTYLGRRTIFETHGPLLKKEKLSF